MSSTPPEPQGPNEHFLYLGVIMLVPAILTVGGFVAWMVFAFDGKEFPEQARQIVFASLAFLFGGGIAATVKKQAVAQPTPPNTNPGTPGFPPEQIAAVTMGGLAVVGQFLPLDDQAKAGIVDVVVIIAPTVAVAGAAVRVGRQRFWQNFFRVDADDDPATPDTMIPVPLIVTLAGVVLVAVALAIALAVVLIL